MPLTFFSPTILSALLLATCPLCSQFETKLSPQTATAFESYVKNVEQQLATTWENNGVTSILPGEDKKLKRGDLLIRPENNPNPMEVPDGLIHDWSGAVFIPHTSLARVVALLQNFNRHSAIYPEVVRSRLLSREGNDLEGYWRLERKQPFVPAVFDVKQEVHYRQIAPGKWICHAYARDIQEVDNAGTAKESDYPVGEGLGLLWKLYAYWSLEAKDDGVMAECRTLSLSRSIPNGLGWMIKPYIQNVPRESLTSTLRNTRKALQ